MLFAKQNDFSKAIQWFMGVRRNFSMWGKNRHYAYLFLVVDDATQIDVYKK